MPRKRPTLRERSLELYKSVLQKSLQRSMLSETSLMRLKPRKRLSRTRLRNLLKLLTWPTVLLTDWLTRMCVGERMLRHQSTINLL